MTPGLMRMSEVDPAAVKRYLLSRPMRPEIIDWKYFDPCFNRGQERAVVCVRKDQVAGFLGLIPFHLETGDIRADCAWSCDWSVDPQQGGGMGLLLVKRARELYDGIFNLGGNENTRQVFPRFADRTVPDAGISLVLPLRLGSILPRLRRGIFRNLLNRRESLKKIPLRWLGRQDGSAVTIEPGLDAKVAALFDAAPRRDWRPRYDSEFLSWQFRRCPAISCWSCCACSQSPPRAAALLWRSEPSNGFWRFVLCGDPADLQQIGMLIDGVVSFVHTQGCLALFTIISHQQCELFKLLRRRGFLRHGRLPFYVMRGRHSDLPLDDFAVLNFLDADLAYRFEQE
jgi:hypothetical protein